MRDRNGAWQIRVRIHTGDIHYSVWRWRMKDVMSGVWTCWLSHVHGWLMLRHVYVAKIGLVSRWTCLNVYSHVIGLWYTIPWTYYAKRNVSIYRYWGVVCIAWQIAACAHWIQDKLKNAYEQTWHALCRCIVLCCSSRATKTRCSHAPLTLRSCRYVAMLVVW